LAATERQVKDFLILLLDVLDRSSLRLNILGRKEMLLLFEDDLVGEEFLLAPGAPDGPNNKES